MNEQLDCIYYSQVYPRNQKVLTLLSLIFDRIYFPGVWVPQTEVDERAINDEVERIIKNHREKRKGKISNDTCQVLGLMKFAKYAKILKDICIFTGKPGHAGVLEDGAKELVMVIEEMIYGPSPPNFTPCPSLGFAKGLPGESSTENSVNGPSWIAYPANSIIFSQKYNIPLVNDHPELPMPFVSTNAKSNAQALSTYLALEAIKIVFPHLGALSPEEIVRVRESLKDDLIPFRMKMLALSKQLNEAISSHSSIQEIQKEAKFIVDTTIRPEIENVKRAINDASKSWCTRLINLAANGIELLGNFATINPLMVFAKVFARIGQELTEIRDEQKNKNSLLIGSGLSYLIKLSNNP